MNTRIKNLTVLKFGGSSLSTPEKIRAVAARVAELSREGRRLVVVVSAMGQTTDELLNLAQKVSSRPNRRELDMLLTTGERIAMALMSMALHDFGCPAISFTGSQAGVLTNGSFSNAEIMGIKPIRVVEELRRGRVVVLAGFQGVDPKTKEITTLGRGGSDTTAIAMAATLGADRCEMYKDVDGIYGADPKIISMAPLYPKMPLADLYEFCFWGAKILNVRSVEWAIKGHVPIFLGRSVDFHLGTAVTPKDKRSTKIVGLHSHARVLDVIVKAKTLKDGLQMVRQQLDKSSLPMPQILLAKKIKSSARYFFTLDAETTGIIGDCLKHSRGIQIENENLSSVALTNRPGALPKMPFSESAYFCSETARSNVIFVPSADRISTLTTIGSMVFR